MICLRMPWQPKKGKIHAKDKENHQDDDKYRTLAIMDNDVYDMNDSNPKTKTIKIITDDPTLEDALDFESYSKQLEGNSSK